MDAIFAALFGESVWAVLQAVLLLLLAFIAAAVVKSLTVKVLAKTKLQALLGSRDPESGRNVTEFIGKLLHLIVFLLFVPGIFERLGMTEVSSPILGVLNTMWGYLPNVLAALSIIVMGCMAAKLSGNIVERLIGASGLDERLASRLERRSGNFVLSKTIGSIVHAVLVIFFLVESFGVLRLEVLTNIGNAVIAYLPYVLAAVLILLACCVGSSAAEKALLEAGHPGLAKGAKAGIYSIGVFMVLSELGIAPRLVNAVFILGAASLAVAFALSFGIGGREFAGHMLKKLEDGAAQKREQDAP